MAIFINGKKCLNLPEQVNALTEDNEAIHDSIKNDEASISANAQQISENAADIETLKTKTDKMVDTNTEQQITAQKTFTQGIKTNKVTNVNGYAVLADDGSANLNVGNSSRALKLLGSATRPQYNGSDVALLTDTTGGQWDTLMANIGIGRWANQTMFNFANADDNYFYVYDDLAPYYTNISRYMNGVTITTDKPIKMYTPFSLTYSQVRDKQYVFSNINATNNNEFICRGGYLPWSNCFRGSTFSKVSVADGETCYFYTNIWYQSAFTDMPNLTEIGAFDMSKFDNSAQMYWNFLRCPKLKSIHMKHFKYSFNISQSTAFGESDLVEIISNLDAVTSTQTLTMGSTNLSKLTSAEILVATGKGWVLA